MNDNTSKTIYKTVHCDANIYYSTPAMLLQSMLFFSSLCCVTTKSIFHTEKAWITSLWISQWRLKLKHHLKYDLKLDHLKFHELKERIVSFTVAFESKNVIHRSIDDETDLWRINLSLIPFKMVRYKNNFSIHFDHSKCLYSDCLAFQL